MDYYIFNTMLFSLVSKYCENLILFKIAILQALNTCTFHHLLGAKTFFILKKKEKVFIWDRRESEITGFYSLIYSINN